MEPTETKSEEKKDWKELVLEDVQKFASATEVNFRGIYTQSLKRPPMPELADFVLNHFCDGLTGIYVHLICTFVGSGASVEKIVRDATTKKFAEFRAQELRRKIAAVRSTQ